MNPILDALRSLGGSGSIEEIYDKVVESENLSDDQLSLVHDPEKSARTEIAYRLAWSRTYLKKTGFLENSSRGIWALTSSAATTGRVNPKELSSIVRNASRKESAGQVASGASPENSAADSEEPDVEEEWRQKTHRLLTQKLSPAAFERLVQRLLRESGFTQVEVTGRSGDGGIDGRGIARIHGLLSFHVLFQCKRYQGSIGPSEIRDFRGAMVGRSDKGLFITTGTFTPSAVKEATRDGAPPIELVDGKDLIERLKELKLGIKTSLVESVAVDEGWFDGV